MSSKIHPTAIVDSSCVMGEDVEIGPYTVIEADVRIGARTRIDAHCLIGQYTTIGSDCRIFNGAVVGTIPQDLKFKDEQTKLVIGNYTTIREYVTINRGTANGIGYTRIGSHVLLMAYAHIAHDCIIEDHVILANVVTLAGHVHIQDHATVGGLTPIHQFVCIGSYAFVGGASRVSMDVLPYIKAAGSPLKITGINVIGLQRSHFPEETIYAIKQANRIIFREELNTRQAIEKIKETLDNSIPEIKKLILFVESSERGISK